MNGKRGGGGTKIDSKAKTTLYEQTSKKKRKKQRMPPPLLCAPFFRHTFEKVAFECIHLKRWSLPYGIYTQVYYTCMYVCMYIYVEYVALIFFCSLSLFFFFFLLLLHVDFGIGGSDLSRGCLRRNNNRSSQLTFVAHRGPIVSSTVHPFYESTREEKGKKDI